MDKNKPPSFPLFAQDFMLGTLHMAPDQVGGYIRLLCQQWDKGCLPSDLKMLKKISGVSNKSLDIILQKFVKKTNEIHEFYVNERMEKEWNRYEAFRLKQSLNGSKGGRPVNSEETQTKAKHYPDESLSLSLSLSPSLSLSKKEEGGPRSRYEIISELKEFLKQRVQKYYQENYNKAQAELLKFQNDNNITEQSLKSDQDLNSKWIEFDGRVCRKYFDIPIQQEVERCYDYYAARNFEIGDKPIRSWRAVMRTWMNTRDRISKKPAHA